MLDESQDAGLSWPVYPALKVAHLETLTTCARELDRIPVKGVRLVDNLVADFAPVGERLNHGHGSNPPSEQLLQRLERVRLV